ncbi:DUF2637 domain-containing protein [Streptomyces fenghuangensis]|uniref:DUF2637 domain-containing protein n=1 Tax=Streptomyces sp. ICN903 TaxID=2964654 RepID=UPI001EDB6E09|nr:DUF2637 domain-containing protein [Streptomyces sp. ICN903]MCG3041352.1 DUF2637 domain-containing protein [Streptomyces sp. ICN903]
MSDQGPHFDPYGTPPGPDSEWYRTGVHPDFDPWFVPEQRAPAPPDVDVLDPSWDFEAELAKLLQDSGHAPHRPHGREHDSSRARPASTEHSGGGAHTGTEPPADETTRVLRRFDAGDTAETGRFGGAAPARRAGRSAAERRHRRRRRTPHRPELSLLHVFSYAVAALTAGIVAMVSVLGGLVSYDPLRLLAGPTVPADLARWWPLLIYGPWLTGSLSILRATVLRRRVRHSWAVVILFSAVAVVLCVAHAPKTLTGVAAAGLPPITALACFHQLVGQITLTQPRHALPRRPAPPPQRGPLPRRRTTYRVDGPGRPSGEGRPGRSG